MGLYKYSVKSDEKTTGRAQGFDFDASYKDLSQVCGAIKGKRTEEAEKILGECIKLEKPIEYKKFSARLGHRSQLHGKKGRFPKKECLIALKLLKSAKANAEHKGLDSENLEVMHAAAYKQRVSRRYKKFWVGGNVIGYGRHAMWANYVTCRMEIILKQAEPKAEKAAKKAPKKNAGKGPSEEAPKKEKPAAKTGANGKAEKK